MTFYRMRTSHIDKPWQPYIRIMELPTNSLIPSRHLLRLYDKKSSRSHTPNQRVKYIENDEYPNWRENASVLEHSAAVPSEGKGFLFEMNNWHNRN